MNKPKVAFFDFACCEGCQLQVANLGEELLDILGVIDVVEFREVMSEKWDGDYDIAIIEGSITTDEAAEIIKKIRSRSKILVAYGSCAVTGGVNGMKNTKPLKDSKDYVYKECANFYETIPTMPVHKVVDVEYMVPGCPIYAPELLKVLKTALQGLPYKLPDYAVCVECRFNENECMYDQGITCLGPVTRAGCNSWCINNGNKCYGCRGLLDNPNMQGAKEVMHKYGLEIDDILKKVNMYNAAMEDSNG